MRHLPSILLLSATTLLVGCGGGAALGRAIGNAIGNSIANAFTGFPDHSVEGYVSDGGSVVQSDVLRVGDAGGDALRAMFGFDMPVTSFNQATLRLHIDSLQGQPFAKLGELWLDVVDLGGALDAGDFLAPIIDTMPIMSSPATGEIDVDITAMAQAAQLAGTGNIHFRLRMTTPDSGDVVSDHIILSSHDAGVDTYKPSIFFWFNS